MASVNEGMLSPKQTDCPKQLPELIFIKGGHKWECDNCGTWNAAEKYPICMFCDFDMNN